MAEKHVVTFTTIHEYFKLNTAQLKKGENAYNSGHVTNLIYDASVQPPLVKGEVSASMRKRKYTVEMFLDSEGSISTMTCNCPRGQEICHHMAAFAFHCHYNISVTDKSCSWSTRKTDGGKVQKIKDIYKAKPYRATSRTASMEEVDKFKKELLECHTVGFSWLLRDEASEEFGKTVPTIEQILFSKEYVEADYKISFFLEHCKIDAKNINSIERNTVGQSSNENWLLARKHRLTASKFGGVLSAIGRDRFPPSLFKNLLETYNLGRVLATQWGKEHEQTAVEAFTKDTGKVVAPTGLWLDECGFLGASPDGLVGKDEILEVKCPYKIRNTPLDVALTDKSYIVYYDGDQPIFVKNKSAT